MFDNNQGNWIFSDRNTKEIRTSKQRLDRLLQEGFKFESCISQSAVIDCLTFFTFFTQYGENKVCIKERKKISKLTLGETIAILQKHKLVNDPILSRLEKYNSQRNLIVHRVIREDEPFDFNNFYRMGENIIIDLVSIAQDYLKSKLKSNVSK